MYPVEISNIYTCEGFCHGKVHFAYAGSDLHLHHFFRYIALHYIRPLSFTFEFYSNCSIYLFSPRFVYKNGTWFWQQNSTYKFSGHCCLTRRNIAEEFQTQSIQKYHDLRFKWLYCTICTICTFIDSLIW